MQSKHNNMDDIHKSGEHVDYDRKEQLKVYEVIYEAISRGCIVAGPELGVSEPCDFSVVDGKIMLPLHCEMI